MKSVKAAIFDLGNVLVAIDNTKSLREFLPFIQNKKNLAEIEEILYPHSSHAHHTWSTTMLADFHMGKTSSRAFYTHIKKELNFSPHMTFERFKTIWPDRFSLKEDMVSLLPKLKVTYRFMLSDTNELDANWLVHQFPFLFTYFSKIFFSHDEHIDKYSHQAWHNVMAVSKLPPEHHVFIDDRPDHVERANELGIHGVVYTSTKKLIESLTSEGIL